MSSVDLTLGILLCRALYKTSQRKKLVKKIFKPITRKCERVPGKNPQSLYHSWISMFKSNENAREVPRICTLLITIMLSYDLCDPELLEIHVDNLSTKKFR